MKPIPNYGVMYSFEEFEGMVNRGEVTNDDGHGCYIRDDKMSAIHVDLDQFWFGFPVEEIREEGYTHVIWFNK